MEEDDVDHGASMTRTAWPCTPFSLQLLHHKVDISEPTKPEKGSAYGIFQKPWNNPANDGGNVTLHSFS